MRKFFGVFITLLITASLFAQGGAQSDQIVKSTAGQAGTVRVCTSTATGTPCSPLATIYSDITLSTPIVGSVVTTDLYGNYSYYAANGTYKEQVTAGTYTFSRVITISSSLSTSGIQDSLNVGNDCPIGEYGVGLTHEIFLNCAPLPAVNITAGLSLPPPFPVPAGQAVAWAFPSTCTAASGDPGATNGGALCGPTTGWLYMKSSGGLSNWYWYNLWDGFTMPTLPNDAAIQGVYPVIIGQEAGSPFQDSVQYWASPTATGTGSAGNLLNTPSGRIGWGGEYYSAVSLGATTGAVTGAKLVGRFFQSLALSGDTTMTTNMVGLAIYYTTANAPQLVGFQVPVPSDTSTLAPLASPTFTGTPAAPTAATGTNTTQLASTAFVQRESQLTLANCSSSASPAVCSAAYAGSVTVAASATTKVVNTTAVTANSQILLTFDSSLGTKLSVTCNTTYTDAWVSARTAATSFTITVASAPTTNPACFSYRIIN